MSLQCSLLYFERILGAFDVIMCRRAHYVTQKASFKSLN